MLFINVVLPVFLIVLSGLFLGRKLALDSTTLTNLSLYVLAPALTFSALFKNPISIGKCHTPWLVKPFLGSEQYG